jgi:hypothetical protein
MPLTQANRRYLPPAQNWQLISKRRVGFASASVLAKLYDYDNLPAREVAKRVTVLDTIIAGVEKVVAQYPSDNDAQLFLAAAVKERRMIAKADGNWGQLRQLLGGGSRNRALIPGPTNHLALPGNQPGCERVYSLEAMDPHHRPLALISNTFFLTWLSDTTDLNFFDWLSTKPVTFDKVLYTDPSERWKYVALFREDRKLYHYKDPQPANPATDDARMELLSTYDWATVFSGKGFGIWVLSRLGMFYTARHEERKFHHSSFLGGARIKCGGEWAIQGGRLLYISHKTGHYRSSPMELQTALQVLDRRVDLSRVVACVTDYGAQGETHTLVKAGEYLKKGGKLGDCESLNQKLTKDAMHFAKVPAWNSDWLKKTIYPYIRHIMTMNPDHLL